MFAADDTTFTDSPLRETCADDDAEVARSLDAQMRELEELRRFLWRMYQREGLKRRDGVTTAAAGGSL